MERVKPKPLGELALLLEALAGFAVATLVMLGIGGSVYKLVAPGGWLAGVFGRSLAGGMAAILAFIIIGACIWLARDWIPARTRNRSSELLAYGLAAAGAMYLAELLMKGGLL